MISWGGTDLITEEPPGRGAVFTLLPVLPLLARVPDAAGAAQAQGWSDSTSSTDPSAHQNLTCVRQTPSVGHVDGVVQ